MGYLLRMRIHLYLAVELQLRDGALFVPDNASYRWPQLSNGARLAAWLESHKGSVLAAVLLCPILLWGFVFHLMPALAGAVVPLVPDQVKEQMGQQTFYALKKTALDPIEALLARKEYFNEVVFGAMEQFVVEAPDEIAEALTQPTK